MKRLDLEGLLKIIIARIDEAFQRIEVYEEKDSITFSIVVTELEDLFKGGCDVAEKFFKGGRKSDWLPYTIDVAGRVHRLGTPPPGRRLMTSLFVVWVPASGTDTEAEGRRLGRPPSARPVTAAQIVLDRASGRSWRSIEAEYRIPKTSARRCVQNELRKQAVHRASRREAARP